MATLAQVRTAVDNRLTALWPAFTTFQTNFFARHGYYWQGLHTHTITPADGNTVLPDIGLTVPDYQIPDLFPTLPTDPTLVPLDPWPLVVRTTALEMDLECTQYDGPGGKGYVVTCTVKYGANVYQRSQVGPGCPETWRTVAWHQVA